MGDKCGRQVWETNVGDKCKLIRPKASRVGDKRETSVNSCGPWRPEWETRGTQVYKAPRVGNKCGRQDKWETSVNSCGPRHPEWETRGGKCKPMRPKEPRVGDRRRQVGDMWETSVNSCGPRHPEWETRGRQV